MSLHHPATKFQAVQTHPWRDTLMYFRKNSSKKCWWQKSMQNLPGNDKIIIRLTLPSFVCFATSQVNSYGHGRMVSSLIDTFFSWASLNKQLTSTLCTYIIFACNWQQLLLNDSAEGRRMTVEIISWSISTKVWDRARIELTTPGSAVRHASVDRHVTDYATWPCSHANY